MKLCILVLAGLLLSPAPCFCSGEAVSLQRLICIFFLSFFLSVGPIRRIKLQKVNTPECNMEKYKCIVGSDDSNVHSIYYTHTKNATKRKRHNMFFLRLNLLFVCVFEKTQNNIGWRIIAALCFVLLLLLQSVPNN